jgi:glycerol kinase
VYAFEGITNFTGATIAWLRDQLGLIESPEETERLAMAVPDNGGVYFVPAFVGLSAPYWKPKARAAISGLTPASTKSHVVRAALEGIAYRICDVLALMGREAGVDLQQVQADGGAVNNRFLMQFVADITRLTVHASLLPELSALGAVFAGLIGLGVYPDIEALAQLPHAANKYFSVMPVEIANEYYCGWQKAVRQVISE